VLGNRGLHTGARDRGFIRARARGFGSMQGDRRRASYRKHSHHCCTVLLCEIIPIATSARLILKRLGEKGAIRFGQGLMSIPKRSSEPERTCLVRCHFACDSVQNFQGTYAVPSSFGVSAIFVRLVEHHVARRTAVLALGVTLVLFLLDLRGLTTPGPEDWRHGSSPTR
jgi:hypothetical protein